MNEEKSRKYGRVVIKCKDKGGTKSSKWPHRYKKSLLGLLAGVMLATPALAKYECQGTGKIVGQRYLTSRIFEADEDTDGDLKPDVTSLYVSKDCLVRLRQSKYGSENKEKRFEENRKAFNKYLLWKNLKGREHQTWK